MFDKENKREWLWAFIISVFIITTGFAFMGVYPFGKYTMCCSDMRYQFIELTAGIFNNIKAGKSLFLTWCGGMGINLYAWSTYLLFNPLNILFLFFDIKMYQEIYLLIIIIKMGLIGLCTSVYLKKSKYINLDGFLNIVFAVLYAFGNFCIRSLINVMWLDNVAMLPLVLLGIERIIEKRKVDLLFFSFLFCVMTNFYLAYITGIFAVMYFVFYYINVSVVKNAKHILKSFLLCGVAVFLVAGSCAVILLPVWNSISNTYVDLFKDASDHSVIRFAPLYVLRSLLFVQEGQTALTDTIHGFFGIVPLFLGIVLLFNKNIKQRERISAFVWMVFMILSMFVRPVYLMWHIFREPVGFYGRFIYTTAFLFIMFSARCIKSIKFYSRKIIIITGLLLFLGGFYSLSGDTTFWLIKNFCVVALFILAYVICIYFISKNKKRFNNIIGIIVLCEAFAACIATLHMSKINDRWPLREQYIEMVDKTRELKELVKDDKSFYRMSDANTDYMNIGINTDFNTLQCFSSFTNQQSLKVLYELGLTAPYDYRQVLPFFDNTVADSLLGVKYVMVSNPVYKAVDSAGRDVLTSYSCSNRLFSENYDQLAENGAGYLFENKKVFPVMFAVDEGVKDVSKDFYDKDKYITAIFRNQEKFLNSLYNTDYKFYTEYDYKNYKVINGKIEGQKGKWDPFTLKLTNLPEGAKLANEGDQVGQILYNFVADEPGEYFLETRYTIDPLDRINVESKVKTCANGLTLNNLNYLGTGTFDIGHYDKGDIVDITIKSMRDVKLTRPVVFRLDQTSFDKIYNEVTANALQDIHQEDNDIVAVSDFDQKKLIFSSISYDDGFHVYIDGEETEKIRLADGFLGYYVPEGRHNVVIKYVSPGFVEGRNISLIFLVLSALVLILNSKIKTEETDDNIFWAEDFILPEEDIIPLDEIYYMSESKEEEDKCNEENAT